MTATFHYQYQSKHLLRPVRGLMKHWYRGSQFRCNICGNHFRRFIILGEKHGRSLCPACGSVESSRLIWLYLTNEVLGKKNKKKFLLCSPEPVLLKKMKKHDIDLAIVQRDDLISPQPKNSRQLTGGVFDVILFLHQLEYLDESEEVLPVLKRLLRPGGFVLIQTLVNQAMDRKYDKIVSDEDRDRLKEFMKPGVKRVFGSDLQKTLSKAGFMVETIDYGSRLGSAAVQYYQLGKGQHELIYKCKKP
jgi:SAM-dependent methyltransferase